MAKDFRQPSAARHVAEIANSEGGSLKAMMATARFLQSVDRALAACLPGAWAGDVHAARLQGGNLTLAVASAAIATRLRLESAALCEQLSGRLGVPITSLKLVIAPIDQASPAARKKRALSAAARSALRGWRSKESS